VFAFDDQLRVWVLPFDLEQRTLVVPEDW